MSLSTGETKLAPSYLSPCSQLQWIESVRFRTRPSTFPLRGTSLRGRPYLYCQASRAKKPPYPCERSARCSQCWLHIQGFLPTVQNERAYLRLTAPNYLRCGDFYFQYRSWTNQPTKLGLALSRLGQIGACDTWDEVICFLTDLTMVIFDYCLVLNQTLGFSEKGR